LIFRTIGPGAEVLIENARLPKTARAEDLTISEWAALSRAYTRFKARKTRDPNDTCLEERPPPTPERLPVRPTSVDQDPFYRAFQAMETDKEKRRQTDKKIFDKVKLAKKMRGRKRKFSVGYRSKMKGGSAAKKTRKS
jgi:hypothetical protein